MTPQIMHVDIDAFFASVEQLKDPRLRDRPVVVGSGVIASCSYEARSKGLKAGMPLARAKDICPEAVVLEGEERTYRAFANMVFDLCRRVSPGVEAHLDEAYCDLTGLEKSLRLASELKKRVRRQTGLTVSLGVGTSRMIARMAGASGKPDGLVAVAPGAEVHFVENRPVEELEGIGQARTRILHELNISTIGELRVFSRNSLRKLFGRDGEALYERCRGRDERGVGCEGFPKSISRETSFRRDTADAVKIEGMLRYLTGRAARSMRDMGLQCEGVEVYLQYVDRQSMRRSRAMQSSTHCDDVIFRHAENILNAIWTRRAALHRIGVKLHRFHPNEENRQGMLFISEKQQDLSGLYECLDGLRDKFGHSVVVNGKVFEACKNLKRKWYGYKLRTPSLTK